jgi:hypothetical protein
MTQSRDSKGKFVKGSKRDDTFLTALICMVILIVGIAGVGYVYGGGYQAGAQSRDAEVITAYHDGAAAQKLQDDTVGKYHLYFCRNTDPSDSDKGYCVYYTEKENGDFDNILVVSYQWEKLYEGDFNGMPYKWLDKYSMV